MAPRATTIVSLLLGLVLTLLLSWQLFCQHDLAAVLSHGSHIILGVDGGSSVSLHSPDDDDASSAALQLQLCGSHGFGIYKPRSHRRRKVYDLIMVNTELDMLELRLHTLHEHVDYFIIVESPKTFQGADKNLTVLDSWARFGRYHDKMFHHRLVFPRRWSPRRAWDSEDLQRDAMYEQVFPLLARQGGLRGPALGDVLLVSDVDEIPRPETVDVLRACAFPRRTTLASRFYYYSFQNLHSGPEWHHPQATFYQGWRTLRPTNLRNGDGGLPFLRDREKASMRNASWHCSSCFGTMEGFLNKMASFSHTWMNGEEFRHRERIADAVRRGVDVWGREGDRFTRVERNEDVPAPLREGRFGYMLDRDGESAGFSDYP
ncbi:hypothetical protein ESCO_001235 [Escovopsis weberi]|uniref:Beta-1 n=1 Tax=Escovopsis weberi TaxID=150374 RepID=A0A0M8N4F1_ESCWE|nr:hypothetical protein ESCO_001235 [Escovopsis weberi]